MSCTKKNIVFATILMLDLYSYHMANSEKYLNNYSDEELIALVEERNTLAFKVLYQRYNKSLYSFIRRYTGNREISEDLLQEAFTKVWFSAHQFNSNKGTFKAWLFTIGINTTRNEMVKSKYGYKYSGVEELVTVDGGNNCFNEGDGVKMLEHAELKETVNYAINQLNPLLREVLLLKHFHGLKFREISEMTDTPEGTLKARFHHAVVQLRKYLKTSE